ncbi:hypothetical protein FA15DRAFT_603008 [Coprinopsis marcescibilis]|uniref:Nucleotidyltransferase n=1 Tax=Coprinopsis marcescibilis TaxID=230819 RepID=A0A5C3KF02_COPMA|nr:hypothetical protein FA15DRAFT_603008 [Coprinopsis marcescibilis]
MEVGQDPVENQPVSAANSSRSESAPVELGAASSPIPPIFVPPPPLKSISLADPVRDSVPSPPEPGSGPHDHTSTLTTIAWDVVNTLRESGYRCAFFGSMGCWLYGNTRLPEDLDVLVFSPPASVVDPEFIKKGLVKRNNQFYTKPSVDPAATYRVLFHHIPQHAVLPPNFTRRFCKVDVLLPGLMNLPYLTESEVKEVEGLPVVPVLVLLLQKLQGWDDHIKCVELHKHRKHTVDVKDIKSLLERVGEMPVRLYRPWSERELFGAQFVNASEARVKAFCARFPETADLWEGLGFEVA